jgi:hypothetical protein
MGLSLNPPDITANFLAHFTPAETGTHFATITLKSQTFERQKTFSFYAEVPAAIPEPVAEIQPEIKTEDKLQPPPVTEEPPPEETDILKSVLIFVAINILVIIIGLSIYLIIKLKKNKATEAEE